MKNRLNQLVTGLHLNPINWKCAGEEDPAYRISSLAVDTGIEDLSIEHDHYLYGIPKRGCHPE